MACASGAKRRAAGLTFRPGLSSRASSRESSTAWSFQRLLLQGLPPRRPSKRRPDARSKRGAGAKCDLVVLDVGRPAQRNVWVLR